MNDLTPLVNETLEEVKREAKENGVDTNKLNMEFWLTSIIDTLIILMKNGLNIEHLTKKQRRDLPKVIIQIIASDK